MVGVLVFSSLRRLFDYDIPYIRIRRCSNSKEIIEVLRSKTNFVLTSADV